MGVKLVLGGTRQRKQILQAIYWLRLLKLLQYNF